ncbi:YIP1 family protein [Tritonibacter mobilis]|nr:YIP1 family protein [Tritonibacter mobilis]
MNFKDLLVETIVNPASAARRIMALNLTDEVVWTGFALNVVLSVLLYAGQSVLLGDPSNALFPGLSPALFGAFLVVLQLSYTAASMVAARWMGGDAEFGTILGLLVWLRIVNIVVQVIAIAMVFVIAPLAVLFNFAAALYGLYVLAHFTKEGFGLSSLGKSAGVILLAGLGAMIAVLILMGLFAPTILETSNV